MEGYVPALHQPFVSCFLHPSPTKKIEKNQECGALVAGSAMQCSQPVSTSSDAPFIGSLQCQHRLLDPLRCSLSCSLSLSLSHTHYCSHIHTLSLSLSLCITDRCIEVCGFVGSLLLSLSLSFTHTLWLSLSHTHTLAHTHSLSLPLTVRCIEVCGFVGSVHAAAVAQVTTRGYTGEHDQRDFQGFVPKWGPLRPLCGLNVHVTC